MTLTKVNDDDKVSIKRMKKPEKINSKINEEQKETNSNLELRLMATEGMGNSSSNNQSSGNDFPTRKIGISYASEVGTPLSTNNKLQALMSQIGSPVPNIRFGGPKKNLRRCSSNKNFNKVLKRMSLVNRGDISPLTPLSAIGR